MHHKSKGHPAISKTPSQINKHHTTATKPTHSPRMYNTETIEMRPSCFVRRKRGTEIIAAETIYIQTAKSQQVKFIYLCKLLYTNICNNNSQRKRDHQFER